MSADAIKGANPLKDDVLNTIQRPVKFGRGGKWEKDGMLQVQYHGIQQGDGGAVARSAPEIARPHQWVLRSVAGASIDFPAIVVSLPNVRVPTVRRATSATQLQRRAE
jgi:hypothetical protein